MFALDRCIYIHVFYISLYFFIYYIYLYIIIYYYIFIIISTPQLQGFAEQMMFGWCHHVVTFVPPTQPCWHFTLYCCQISAALQLKAFWLCVVWHPLCEYRISMIPLGTGAMTDRVFQSWLQKPGVSWMSYIMLHIVYICIYIYVYICIYMYIFSVHLCWPCPSISTVSLSFVNLHHSFL